MNDLAYSMLFLNLFENVHRKISGIRSAYQNWKLLYEIYMVKSLPNKIYLLKRFFGFKMDPIEDLEENLDDFKKISL